MLDKLLYTVRLTKDELWGVVCLLDKSATELSEAEASGIDKLWTAYMRALKKEDGQTGDRRK